MAKKTLLPDNKMSSTDETDDLIFRATVMFSVIVEKTAGLTTSWKNWCSTLIQINREGKLKHQVAGSGKVHRGSFDISGDVQFTLMEDNVNTITSLDIIKEFGIVVKNRSAEGIDSYFRLLLNHSDFTKFHEAVDKVAKSLHIDNVLQQSNYMQSPQIMASQRSSVHSSTLELQSSMRKSIMQAMDKFDKRSTTEKVLAKRGALHFLPVYWRNDLVHGSWWFTVGSVLFMISSILVVINGFSDLMNLGDDDSILTNREYEATWILMGISGFFYTIGSAAFMRAVHEDPPMKPLSNWYHFQSDELLGSWFFVFGTLPFVPYCLIYLAASNGSSMYLGALVIVVVCCFGALLFVRGCYPTADNTTRRQYVQPLLHVLLYCCCQKRFLEKHLANDWLSGTWIILIGAFIATVGSLLMLFYYIAVYDSLLVFIFGMGLVYNLAFTIGSAYFVAGSYEELLVARSFDNPGISDPTANISL